jgi:hypothetical protein
LTGQRLWLTEVRDRYTFSVGKEDHWTRTWPLRTDLDGDGRAEIVIPDFEPEDKYSGVRALDAVTGKTRWTRPMTPYPGYFDGLVHLLEGPDLDGDGTKDIVAVWRMDITLVGLVSRGWDPSPGRPAEKSWLYVDALSGKDGHGLWWWRGEIGGRPLAFQTPVRAPFWCGRGPDGWPLLAVALGGDPAPGVSPENPFYPPDPPVVHLLAASTGQELHTITALSWPQTADIDGDRLGDIWGSVEGKLRALRGPVPETWRALGKLQRAGDLDGDGIGDVLSDDLQQSPGSLQKAASHTVLARSGRDGRLLWKTRLDAWQDWSFWPEETDGYTLSALPMPAGDLDRDGTPDVLVHRRSWGRNNDPPASLPLEILSGRSGRHLWSAGSIPPLGFRSIGYCRIIRTEARVCEPGKPPDLIVVYDLPRTDKQMRLARLSGRDGGFVWDALLFEQQPGAIMAFADEPAFGDLDGDGCLDATLLMHFVFPSSGGPLTGGPQYELRAFSLRDGKLLWRRPAPPAAVNRLDFQVGDLDGDGRAEGVLSTVLPGPFRQRGRGFIELAALEGSDGSTRWTWRDDYVVETESLIPYFALGDLDGKGRKEVCVSLPGQTGRRLVILDGQGQERIRDAPAVLPAGTLAGPPADPDPKGRDEYLLHAGPPVDLDGDGRDELLLRDDKRLSAFRSDLTGLWAWRDPPLLREILPAERGRPATVLLKSGVGLDGVTGRAIWSAGHFDAVLTDQAGTSGPRVLDTREGATVCRLSIPTSGEGRYLPPHGMAALPARAADDPRWERPLPWAGLSHRIALLYFLVAGINVGAPLGIFWLATRRGIRSLRLLLALPAMVAIPITGLSWLGRLFSTGAGPNLSRESAALVAVLSLMGVPLLAYAGSLTAALLRGRWGRLLILAALTASAGALVGGLGLYFALKQMPAREHYTYAGWYHAVWFGVYVVGVLLLLRRLARSLARIARRIARRGVLGSRRLWSRRRSRAASDAATPSEERPCVRP